MAAQREVHSVSPHFGSRRDTVVVVIHDNAGFCNEVARQLSAQGIKAFAASKPHFAYQIMSQHFGRIDLLITACEMPGMSGRRLAAWLLKHQPGVRVILTSSSQAPIAELSGAPVFREPITAPMLAEAALSTLTRS